MGLPVGSSTAAGCGIPSAGSGPPWAVLLPPLPTSILWEQKQVPTLRTGDGIWVKKLKIELPYDPGIPLLGMHTEDTRIERVTGTPMFIAALLIIARTRKQPRSPSAD